MDYKDLAIKWFNKANNDLIAGKYIPIMHKQVHLPRRGTRMTRIAQIFTDPCASASSVQSVFYCTPSVFICVYLRLINLNFRQPTPHNIRRGKLITRPLCI